MEDPVEADVLVFDPVVELGFVLAVFVAVVLDEDALFVGAKTGVTPELGAVAALLELEAPKITALPVPAVPAVPAVEPPLVAALAVTALLPVAVVLELDPSLPQAETSETTLA